MPPPLLPPEFFIDRSLGRHQVAGALRDAGQTVITMYDHYPDHGERVEDVVWMADADVAGWAVLTKDERIWKKPAELAALANSTLRVFAITNQDMARPEMALRYKVNLHRIIQRCRKPGPYVDVVRHDRLDLRWRPHA